MKDFDSVQIEGQLLNNVYQRLFLNVVLTAIAVMVFATILWPMFPHATMVLWLGAFCLNVLVGLVLSFVYSRARAHENWNKQELRKWRFFFLVRMGLGGFSWGIGPALLMSSAVDAQLALLVGIALVSSSVSVGSMAESLAGIIVFTLFSLMMPAVALWITNDTLLQLIGMVLVGGFAALTMVAKAAQAAARSRMGTEIALKAALAEASSARTMAESASKAKSRFLATMSHELRTPLNAVIGGAQLLHVEKEASPDQSQHIDAIQKSGSHLLSLIENILDLSRVETGELPVQNYDFDLQECIESAVSISKLNAQAKGLVVYSEIDPNLPTWRKGDGQRLSQIVLNLMGNAVKFTNEGEVKISVKPVGPKVQIVVSDTGVGIHPTELEFIFDPFHQADQGSKRRYGGSGLGLAIVKMWAQAMGGTVSVQSTLNKGSCFVLELPLELAKLPKPTKLISDLAKRHPNRSDRAHTGTRHILVVEDDVINQKVVIGLLRSSGNQVTLAENGMQALAAVAKLNDLDLILMDWFMPDIDGLEVTRRLRAGEAGESGKIVPIVALTANAFAQDREECLAAGMDDFLTKPVLLEDLERALEKWVPVAKPSTKAFDELTFQKLASLANPFEPNFAQEMRELFEKTLLETQQIIDKTGPDQDRANLTRAMHSLRSSSATIGAMELSAFAAKHEGLLREGVKPEATLSKQFSEAVERFHKASKISAEAGHESDVAA